MSKIQETIQDKINKRGNFFKALRSELSPHPTSATQLNPITENFDSPSFYSSLVSHLTDFKHETQENEFEYMGTLNKKKEEIDSLLQTINFQANSALNFDLFGVQRGTCRFCNCKAYKSSEPTGKTIGPLGIQCINCGCAANSHKEIEEEGGFKENLARFLISREILEEHLNYQAFVGIFTFEMSRTINFDIRNMFQQLALGGYSVLQTYNCDVNDLRAKLFKKKLFGIKKHLSKKEFDLYGILLEEDFESNSRDWNMLLQLANKGKKENNSYEPNNEIINILLDIESSIENSENKKKNKAIVVSFFCKKGSSMKEFKVNQSILVINVKNFVEKLQIEALHLFYCTQSKKKAIIDSQTFFPEIFKYSLITLITIPNPFQTQHTNKSEQDHLKDLLQINCFNIIEQKTIHPEVINRNLKEIDRKSNLFSSSVFGEDGCLITLCAKSGVPTLYDYNLKNTPNYLKISESEINEAIFLESFKHMKTNQRVALILRPNLIQSDMEEILLNIYRINNFTLIKRQYFKLTRDQAFFLSKLENINVGAQEAYIEMMCNGPIQIILLSHFGGIELSKCISNGTQILLRRDRIHKIKLDEFAMNSDDWLERTVHFNIFKGVKDIFSIEEIVKADTKKTKGNLNSETFRQEILLKDLESGNFNYMLYTSESEMITEEIISLCLPECSEISSLAIFIKPDFLKYKKEIIYFLQELKFKVFKTKTLKLDLSQVSDFISFIGEPNLDLNSEFKHYWSQEIEIIILSKISCKKEILSLLQSFSIYPNKEEINSFEKTKKNLSKALIPCWNNSSNFYAMSLLNPNFIDLNASISEVSENSQDIMEYVLINCFGENISKSTPIVALSFKESFDRETNEHAFFKVTSENLGDFEIRVRKNALNINIEQIEQTYKLVSWYYSLVNSKLMQKCPLTYQKRIFQLRNNLYQIFDCQQYVGDLFIEEILNQTKEHEENIKKFSSLSRNKNGSIVPYLWGEKLGLFVKALDFMKIPNDLELSFGRINLIKGKLKGVSQITDSVHIEEEKTNFEQIWNRILMNLESVYDFSFSLVGKFSGEKAEITRKIENISELLRKKIDLIFQSESYKYSRMEQNLRVLPNFFSPENLRIFCNRAQVLELILHEKFETVSFNYELEQSKLKESKVHPKYEYSGYCLVNTVPAIKSKFSLYGMINFYLIMGIKYSLFYDEEIDQIMPGLVEGFTNGYKLDANDTEFLQGLHKDTVLEESYVRKKVLDFGKIETFLFGISEIDRHLLFVEEKKKELDGMNQKRIEKLFEINQNLKFANAAQAKSLNEEKKQVEKTFDSRTKSLTNFIQKTKINLRFLLDTLSNYSLFFDHEEYFLAQKKNNELQKVKIPKSNYMIPIINEDWEENLDNPKYQKDLNEKILETGIVEKYGGAVFFQNIEKDPIQQKWMVNRPLMVSNLRKHEKDDNLKDGIYVEKIVPNAERMLSSAIDKEIKKFEEFKKLSKINP